MTISHKLIIRQKCEKSIISEIRRHVQVVAVGSVFVASLCPSNRKCPYLTISIVVSAEPRDQSEVRDEVVIVTEMSHRFPLLTGEIKSQCNITIQ